MDSNIIEVDKLPKFKLGEKVGLRGDWILGIIQQTPQEEQQDEEQYFVAWEKFSGDLYPQDQWEWIEESFLTR